MRDAHLLFAKALRTRLQSHQITPGQWYFLRTLWDEEGLSQRELSRRVGTTEPTTVSALRLLARNGMITRVRNVEDIASTVVVPRPLCNDDVTSPFVPLSRGTATAGFTPEEFETLRTLLKRLRDNLAAESE